MKSLVPWIAALAFSFNPVYAYQIAPLGSAFEAKLTNESESRLKWFAEHLGFLVKIPVHEEITQLGFGCPVDKARILEDESCSGRDQPFATPFVIYGVRWNDLPPFRLEDGQGKACKRILSNEAACKPQTVRFSTQPECWLCLFKEASEVAKTKRISLCDIKRGDVKGTLMTRSHFGDLQFLHAMANEEGVPAHVTRLKIVEWIEFAWRVFDEEFTPERLLNTIDILTIKEHFGCTGWRVEDIYILGRADTLRRHLPHIAFGSVLHTVQDSFAAGHLEREPAVRGESCARMRAAQPGRIKEFHSYGKQDSHRHDAEDSRSAMGQSARDRWPDAVEVTRQLYDFYDANAKWKDVQPYVSCLFELSPNPRSSSAGDDFLRVSR